MYIVPFFDRKVQPLISRVPYVHCLTWGVIALECCINFCSTAVCVCVCECVCVDR